MRVITLCSIWSLHTGFYSWFRGLGGRRRQNRALTITDSCHIFILCFRFGNSWSLLKKDSLIENASDNSNKKNKKGLPD